jgi:hypothetical protein
MSEKYPDIHSLDLMRMIESNLKLAKIKTSKRDPVINLVGISIYHIEELIARETGK